MSGKTKIDWCDYSWGVVTGCSKVSSGCQNCYAESIAKRFWGDRKFTDVYFHPERLSTPAHWTKPQTIFITSMSDLFHDDVPTEFILTVFYRMFQYSQHTFIILTKRPKRMIAFFEEWGKSIDRFKKMVTPFVSPPLKNLILGVSVEDQQTADERIPLLLQTPAAQRMVSVEPMLGEIDMIVYFNRIANAGYCGACETCGDICQEDLPSVDFVVVGCESGPRRRPCNLDWMRSLRDQCQAAGVPFFLKQAEIDGKVVKMPALDGRVWDQRPKGE